MAIAQSGQLGANATIKYTAARSGQRLRLIGFTPTGPVDITALEREHPHGHRPPHRDRRHGRVLWLFGPESNSRGTGAE